MKAEKESQKTSIKDEIISYVQMLVFVVVFVSVVNGVILINAKIPSSSMENTIMVNDRIFGNRLAYRSHDPERFDIIIFKFPDDESKKYIKRIIGMPGETVLIVDGKVYIDGASDPLPDSFCPEDPVGSFGPYEVPEGCYFVMGDNRNNSNDSRFWQNSFVSREEILGEAMVRYWPLDKIGRL
ncbi:MAG: signal peptidase I [Lachnospiraceae bacterium]|jgi:signal peptidase I|nr:signal peptidase I [Lachnospiraceae bacterium]MBR3277629.1 signal peptidase I [Lachnospiraceae bacterium]